MAYRSADTKVRPAGSTRARGRPEKRSPSRRADHVQIAHLQRSVGNRAVASAFRPSSREAREPANVVRSDPAHGLVVHRQPPAGAPPAPSAGSALADQFQLMWMMRFVPGGKDRFFQKLAQVRQSDAALEQFVEANLKGRDLRRARQALQTYVPLTDDQRTWMKDQLLSRLDSAQQLYGAACERVIHDVEGEQAARAEFAVAILGLAFTFMGPGLTTAIRSVGASSGLKSLGNVTALKGIEKVALGMQSQAKNLSTVISEVGKTAAVNGLKGAAIKSPRDLTDKLQEAFAVQKDKIVGHVAGNVKNRAAFPDEDLWVYLARWDPAVVTVGGYAKEIRSFWDRWQKQVAQVGKQSTGMVPHGPTPLSSKNIPMSVVLPNGNTRLGLVNKTRVDYPTSLFSIFGDAPSGIKTNYRLVTWIDSDMAEYATSRAGGGRPPRILSKKVAGAPR